MVGQTLGHYRIVEEIEAGGLGVVYRAPDEQLDRDVALKARPAGLLADEAPRKRFRNEALALGKLNHPNIETVHEFGSARDLDLLVMELIHGAAPRGTKSVRRFVWLKMISRFQLSPDAVTIQAQWVGSSAPPELGRE
jgi:serine/threonine protein kinase